MSQYLETREAFLVMDCASWHRSKNLKVPKNIDIIAFLITVRTGHRKAESTARRKDSNRGMFFLALFFIANQ